MELLTWPGVANIDNFTYSKLDHFEIFRGLPFHSYNTGDPDPAVCDLKVYQDYLVYCFIRRNVAPGSRLLEVGGGDSRILRFFSREYECWNIDKCEGMGNGPVKFSSPDYKIIYDYMGSFNPVLPDGYFDFVFSISALEHTPEDPLIRAAIADDIDRVLKPAALSFHCFDIVVLPGGPHWVNGLIPHLYRTRVILNGWTSPDLIVADPRSYFMSEYAYNLSWKPIVKKSYAEMGRPLSYNLLWRKGPML